MTAPARKGILLLVSALLACPIESARAEAPRRRARDLGIVVGTLPPGPLDAITDV